MAVRSLSLASEQLLAALPFAALVINDAGIILLANRAATSLFGHAEDELDGRPVGLLFPGGLRLADQGSDILRDAVNADGDRFGVRVTISPAEDDAIQLVLIQPIQPESVYSTAFRTATFGIAIVGPDGGFLDTNASFAEITGYAEDELRDMALRDLAPTDHRLGMGSDLRALSADVRLARRDGKVTWAQIHIEPAYDWSGLPAYAIVQLFDISARKEAERRAAAFEAAFRTLNSAGALDDALPEALRLVADAAGWACCEYWEIIDDQPHRRAVWLDEELRGPGGATDNGYRLLDHGVEAIRRAFRTSEPVWIPDIPTRPEAEPPSSAVHLGLRSLSLVPLIGGKDALAVVAGFSRTADQPDNALLEALVEFGRLLGQIVERWRAEHGLLLRNRAVEATVDGVLIVDATRPDLPILSANPAVSRITGYPLEELVGQSIGLLQGAETDPASVDAVRCAIREGRDSHAVLIHHRRDGTTFWNEMIISPVRDDQGRIGHLIAIIHDITDRVRVEQQLRESETLLAEAQAIASIGSWDYDLARHTLRCSLEGWRLFGLEDLPEEARTAAALARINRADHAALRQATLQALAERRVVTIDQRVTIPGRPVRTIRFVLQPVSDDAGMAIHVRGTMMDVTEARLAEQAIRDREALQRSVVASLEEGVVVEDALGIYRLCNASAERITGLTAAQLARQSPAPPGWYVVREDGTPYPLEDLPGRQALITGRAQNDVVLGIHHADKSITWCQVTAQPLFHEGERDPYAVVISLRDITESRQAAAELLNANEQLTAQLDALEQRAREITLLSEMGELLSSCQTSDEAYTIIPEMGGRLFPGTSGILALLDDGRIIEQVSAWGERLSGDPAFDVNECWALRRSRHHLVQNTATGLVCRHVWVDNPTAYLCIPLVAQGELLGLLHLAQTAGSLTANRQQLALTVAEHIALALSNLRLRETLHSQSVRDPLTDLYNRRYLEEALYLEGRRHLRTGRGLALLMIDIDHFKQFNDQFGHDAGDLVLREFGRLLRSHIRGSDIACRFGGEEFTLILPEIGVEDATARAGQIRAAVAAMRLSLRGQPLGALTCSIGVAVFPEHAATVEECLTAADQALYRAKAAGRDCVIVAECNA
ncbi:MAG: diguanylate cyclase [Dehalococcoidia bacterium]